MSTPPAQPEGGIAPPSRAAFIFIFITVALDMLALGVMVLHVPGAPYLLAALLLGVSLLVALVVAREPKSEVG